MTLRAIKDKCLIRPDEVSVERGGIVIPELLRKVGRPTGILLQAATDDPSLLACVGKRVLVRTGIVFEHDGRRYMLSACNMVVASIDDSDVVTVLDPIERCQFCKSDGEGNMLMDHNGYCIRCGKNKYGEHRDHRSVKVSGDEVEAFGHTGEYYANREKANGKIISYSGQRKRSAAQLIRSVKR
jgi:hypothetical protein